MPTASGAMFWALIDRWGVSDEAALELIAYSGKLPTSGKRPRFKLSTEQQQLVAVLLEIEQAMQAANVPTAWLKKATRDAPHSPLDRMRGGETQAVLRSLNQAALAASLKSGPRKR
jgi:hypothetical protein